MKRLIGACLLFVVLGGASAQFLSAEDSTDETRPFTKVGENDDGTSRCQRVACHPPGYICCL